MIENVSVLKTMSFNTQDSSTPAPIEPKLMQQLSTRISNMLGLDYPPQRWNDLRRGLRAALSESGDATEEDYIQRLAQQPWRAVDAEVLAFHLTVGETYFWREPQTLTALQDHILPRLLEEKRKTSRRLRLWSAGCCTGEEPYSLAMLLHKMLPDIRDWDVQVLATDLNPRFLNKATTGRYRAWSFRGTPQWVKERYFKAEDGDTFRISPEIARLVTFKPLNLATASYPSPDNGTENIDIIFCRNVLIYMEAAQTQAILNRFTNALNDGGWLALSATETWLAQSPQLASTTFGRAILFEKVTQEAVATPQKTTQQKTAQRPALHHEYSSVRAKRPVATRNTSLAAVPPIPARATYQNVAKESSSAAETEAVLQTGDEIAQARVCANRGQNEEALRWCDKALEHDKLSAPAHYLRASILQESGELAGALQALSHAIFLDPHFVMAHFSAGNLALQAGKTAHAIRHFNNAATLLQGKALDEVVPESDDLTVAHLIHIIRTTLESLT
jgi:chemotaxis protein methyltransferase CheR